MLILLIVVLVILFLGGGGWYYRDRWGNPVPGPAAPQVNGPAEFSPIPIIGIILLIVILILLFGRGRIF